LTYCGKENTTAVERGTIWSSNILYYIQRNGVKIDFIGT
jgi:hypothetical protein